MILAHADRPPRNLHWFWRTAARPDQICLTACYPLPNVTDSLDQSLIQLFGVDGFRAGQREAIDQILVKRDTLVVMPTGSGKSLIYQFCALMLDGTTLVVSPLIALMKDQVDSLQRRHIAATFINSTLSSDEQARRIERMIRGEYRLVYIAPERLRNPAFHAALKRTHIALLAVDEAHCISQWGHDFRPDYLQIGVAREAIGMPMTVALTATATPEVQEDIVAQLELDDAARVVTGFARPNLVFHVRHTPDLASKQKMVRKMLGTVKGTGIIYVGTRREADELSATLESEYHVPSFVYHGGLDKHQRSLMQDAYLRTDGAIMIATNAFGMGVDRADVRFVLHYNIPGTLEAYYQEAGRAGRDGKLAQCMLLYAPQDRNLQEWFIENDAPSQNELVLLHRTVTSRVKGDVASVALEELQAITRMFEVKLRVGLAQLERAGVLTRLEEGISGMVFAVKPLEDTHLKSIAAEGQVRRAHKRAQLDKMIAYAETSDRCRQGMLLEHFGDTTTVGVKPCCDFHIRESRGEPHPVIQRVQKTKGTDPAISTVAETEILLGRGLTVKEVSVARGMVSGTIYHHAAQLIADGRLDLRKLMGEAVELQIRTAIDTAGSTEKLAPIKALLPESIEYGQIRCVIASLSAKKPA